MSWGGEVGTDLSEADLTGADLTGAVYDNWTIFPFGFCPSANGMRKHKP
jgi:hypothetical protein